MKYWFYLAIAIVAEVCGTAAMKSSEGFTRFVPSMLVVTGYAIAFFFLSLTLRAIPVGIAYAIWSAVGILMITLVGWFGFGQKLDAPAFVGLALIVAGVLVLSLVSKTSLH